MFRVVRHIAAIVCLFQGTLLTLPELHGQNPAISEFGLSLATGPSNQLFSLFLVKVYEGEVIERTPLSRDQFIRQVNGRTFSAANPDAENFFRIYKVRTCFLSPDSEAMGYMSRCPTLDDLWRLRFWEYPLQTDEATRVGKGWSEKPMVPSERQMLLLSNYGLDHPMGLVRGEAMFRLLRDMGDPAWVNNYRKGY
ncbi:MAG: hypothetical protein JNM31_14215 [Flavobacteriales bacterium]|nr:hypothetical protein [Flavobacteriales bacterium]